MMQSFGCLAIIVPLNLDIADGLILSTLRGFGLQGNSVDGKDIRSLSKRNSICSCRRSCHGSCRAPIKKNFHAAVSEHQGDLLAGDRVRDPTVLIIPDLIVLYRKLEFRTTGFDMLSTVAPKTSQDSILRRTRLIRKY